MSHFDKEPDPVLTSLYEERRRILYARGWNDMFKAFTNMQQAVHDQKNTQLAARLGVVDARIKQIEHDQGLDQYRNQVERGTNEQ